MICIWSRCLASAENKGGDSSIKEAWRHEKRSLDWHQQSLTPKLVGAQRKSRLNGAAGLASQSKIGNYLTGKIP